MFKVNRLIRSLHRTLPCCETGIEVDDKNENMSADIPSYKARYDCKVFAKKMPIATGFREVIPVRSSQAIDVYASLVWIFNQRLEEIENDYKLEKKISKKRQIEKTYNTIYDKVCMYDRMKQDTLESYVASAMGLTSWIETYGSRGLRYSVRLQAIAESLNELPDNVSRDAKYYLLHGQFFHKKTDMTHFVDSLWPRMLIRPRQRAHFSPLY